MTGKVIHWDNTWGFVQPDDGSSRVFVHFSQIQTGSHFRDLEVGQNVEFETRANPKGREAYSVVPLKAESAAT